MELPDGRIRKIRETRVREGHAHELTCTCFHRMRLLDHDRTRHWLLDALNQARQELNFRLIAYVIMPDHTHFLVRPREFPYSVAAILKKIKQPVAQLAIGHLRRNAPEHLVKLDVGNWHHRFWQVGGGYDRNIWSAPAMRNAVRAGLVKEPEEWVWSSARWYSGCSDAVMAMDRE